MRRYPRSFGASALLAGVVFGAVLLLAGPGYRFHVWSLATGFMLLRVGAYGGLLTIALAAAALWRTRGRSVTAVAALAIGVTVFAIPLRFQRAAASAPPIHDISTDTARPPAFEAIVPLRTGAANPLQYSQDTARLQHEHYPDIKPLILEMPAPQVFARALSAAQESGWRIAAADAEAGRIEATDTTTFFGFKDDVVVRLTPLGSRTVVDVRSVSRIGRGDAGTNARRVRDYLDRLAG